MALPNQQPPQPQAPAPDMNKPLPGVGQQQPQQQPQNTAVDAKAAATQKFGLIIQEAGKMLELLVQAQITQEGDDLYKAIAAVMANSQTALDGLQGQMQPTMNNQPNVQTPAPPPPSAPSNVPPK